MLNFVRAVQENKSPETGPREGMAAVAMIYAELESSKVEKSVCIDDVMSLRIDSYQREIDSSLAIN